MGKIKGNAEKPKDDEKKSTLANIWNWIKTTAKTVVKKVVDFIKCAWIWMWLELLLCLVFSILWFVLIVCGAVIVAFLMGGTAVTVGSTGVAVPATLGGFLVLVFITVIVWFIKEWVYEKMKWVWREIWKCW